MNIGGGIANFENTLYSEDNATTNPTPIMSNKKNLTPFQNENAQSGFNKEKDEVVITAQYEYHQVVASILKCSTIEPH